MIHRFFWRPSFVRHASALAASLLLSVMPLFAQPPAAPNRVENGDFEAPTMEAWPLKWSRTTGAIEAVHDEQEKHRGKASLKVVHTGDKDWAVSQNRLLPVKAGEVYDFNGWIKVEKSANAQFSLIARDADNKTIDWTFSALNTRGTHNWQYMRRRFVVPPGVATMEFRFVGDGPGTVWFDDVQWRYLNSVMELQKNLPEKPIAVETPALRIEVEARSGLFAVTDKRAGHTWRQSVPSDGLIVQKVTPQKDGARLELWDLVNDLTLNATLKLSALAPELSVTLEGNGAMRDMITYPAPFVTEKGTSLVVPINEGIVYPVDDDSINPQWLVAYGGHGICMAWWGVFDEKTGAGMMAIFNTPDDANLEINRRNTETLWGRPRWEAQKGQFGYTRKITYSFFDKGSYVAQAKRYRDYAKSVGLFKTLTQKHAENPNVDLLLGAANIWNWDMKADALCREMKDLGFERVLWSRGGNGDELKQINDLGYLTGVYDIYSDVWAPGGPNWLKTEGWPDDLVWNAGGDWIKGWAHHQKNADGTTTIFPGGVVSSGAWLKRAQTRIPADLKDKPYRARFIDTVTASPWFEDWNPAHPQTRTQDKTNKMATLNYVSKDLKLVTGAETGHDASVPFTHYYEGMLSLGPYRLPDAGRDLLQYKAPTPEFLKFQIGPGYRVPLWELVYHDCTVAQWYWGDYNNKAPEVWPRRDLWNILYATPPMYMFDKKTWDANKEKFVASYKQIAPIARRFGYDEMLSHEWLNSDHTVQRTTWKSGAQIVVNFGDKPFKIGVVEVPTMGWKLIEGKA